MECSGNRWTQHRTIAKSFEQCKDRRPTAIIAKTLKGRGVSICR